MDTAIAASAGAVTSPAAFSAAETATASDVTTAKLFTVPALAPVPLAAPSATGPAKARTAGVAGSSRPPVAPYRHRPSHARHARHGRHALIPAGKPDTGYDETGQRIGEQPDKRFSSAGRLQRFLSTPVTASLERQTPTARPPAGPSMTRPSSSSASPLTRLKGWSAPTTTTDVSALPAPPPPLDEKMTMDPSTPLSMLWTIARNRPDLRRWLIVNPSAPPELLEYIAQAGGPGVNQGLRVLFNALDTLGDHAHAARLLPAVLQADSGAIDASLAGTAEMV
jgi:hypothetical protein